MGRRCNMAETVGASRRFAKCGIEPACAAFFLQGRMATKKHKNDLSCSRACSGRPWAPRCDEENKAKKTDYRPVMI